MKRNFEIVISEAVQDMSNIKLPDPVLLDYYTRISNREIFYNQDVDDNLVEYSYQVLEWNRQDKGLEVDKRKPIRVYINTDGGDLSAVMNFINIIQLSKTPVITIGMGRAYSCGGLMLMSGVKGKRYILQDTAVLIHNGSVGAIGDTGKVMDSFEFTQKNEKRIREFIMKNTKISEEVYDKNYRRDWFMDSEEIIQCGVADKIITDLDEIL